MISVTTLMYMYPNADPRVDFRVEDAGDGNGGVIAFWDTKKLGAQPSDATIQSNDAAANSAANANATTGSTAKSRLQALMSRAVGSWTVADCEDVLRAMIRRFV